MEWFKKHKILTVILVLIVIGVIAASTSGGDSSNNQASNDEQNSENKSDDSDKETVAKIGETARDGKFEFTVKKIDCGKATVGSEFLQEKAQGQFCLLAVSIKNIGDEPQSLFADNQYLFNSEGQKYSADSAATIAAAPQDNDSFYTEINPGNSVKGTIVFDIPKDQKPASAELHDSAFSSGIKVNLN